MTAVNEQPTTAHHQRAHKKPFTARIGRLTGDLAYYVGAGFAGITSRARRAGSGVVDFATRFPSTVNWVGAMVVAVVFASIPAVRPVFLWMEPTFISSLFASALSAALIMLAFQLVLRGASEAVRVLIPLPSLVVIFVIQVAPAVAAIVALPTLLVLALWRLRRVIMTIWIARDPHSNCY